MLKYLQKNPKKSNWKLWVKREGDNITDVHMDNEYPYISIKDPTEERPWNCKKCHVSELGYEEVDNFIFEATLFPASTYKGRSAAGYSFFSEKQKETNEKWQHDGFRLYAGMDSLDEILKALVAGKLNLQNGGIQGTWTFKKFGSLIAVYMYESN